MGKYKIYGLYHIDDRDATRYIGITGMSLRQRHSKHVCEARTIKTSAVRCRNCYRTNWISANIGKVEIEELYSTDDKELAAKMEILYIRAYLEMSYKLVNTTYGTSNYKSGYNISDEGRANIKAARNRPEVQAKMREINLGHVVSSEQRAKISASLKGRPGYKKTDADKANMAVKMLGNTNGKGNKGRVVPRDIVEIIAAKKRGVKQSSETVARRVAANTGLVRKTYNGIEKDFSIDQYTLDGFFIKTWPMITSIQHELKIQSANVYKVMKGERTQAGGFFWKRKETLTTA